MKRNLRAQLIYPISKGPSVAHLSNLFSKAFKDKMPVIYPSGTFKRDNPQDMETATCSSFQQAAPARTPTVREAVLRAQQGWLLLLRVLVCMKWYRKRIPLQSKSSLTHKPSKDFLAHKRLAVELGVRCIPWQDFTPF